jgi:uncharacterized cofD-like protein
MKIVTIGGGTGGSIVDGALTKTFPDLISVVTSFDNGGSSGIIRKEFGSLPHGDIRRRIFAQKRTNNKILEELYSFRFPTDEKNENFLERHSLGNLMILAATKKWGEKEGIKKISKLFNIKGKALPVTYDFADLVAKLQDGQTVFGEDLIGQTDVDRKIEKVYLSKRTVVNQEVVKEIVSADYIILCPGDFYGSLICNFLVDGFKEAIKKSKAKIIYFPNIMTKTAETKGFTLSSFVQTLEKYLEKRVDYIVYNSQKPSNKNLKKYFENEGAEFVINDLKGFDSRVLEYPLLKQNKYIRHDRGLVLRAVKRVIQKEKQEKLFVFDLDDTIVSSAPFRDEFMKHDFNQLKLYKVLPRIFKKIGKKNCILLTHDQYGLQKGKIEKLNLKKYFREIHIVYKSDHKHTLLGKIMRNNKSKNIIVVGDNHDIELRHARNLGLKTICVALDGNKYLNKKLHYLYDFVVEKQSDFTKML